MSASASNLSSKQFGYDLVVGVTQASVNATMEEWLSKVSSQPFIMAYVYNPDAPDKQNPYTPTDWNALVEAVGFDPFTVPNDTPMDSEQMKKLLDQKFAFAFQAEIGLPDFPLDKIPPVISFNKEGSYVTYNMVCKTFKIIEIQPSVYGSSKWVNLSQDDGDTPWDFQFTVDLDLRQDDINNHFHNLPADTQKTIKNLGENAFSVQQLFLDLNNAALSNSYTIQGLKPTDAAYVLLTSVFFGEYFNDLSKDGGVMLGYSVQSNKPFPQEVSLIPTNLNFEVSAYKDSNGKATTDYDAYTLNYLVMSDGHTMPAPVPFTWNWVDKADITKEAGTMAINKNAFVSFLDKLVSPGLNDLTQEPNVDFSVNLIKASITTGFKRDNTPQTLTAVNDGSNHVLTFSYSKSDKSSDTFVPNWGNWSVNYSATCDVYFTGTVIRFIDTVTAHCHLNVDGGVTEGDWAKYQVTTDYTIGVTSTGALKVTRGNPTIVDQSQKPDPNWWSKLISAGTIDNAVSGVQQSLQGFLETFSTNFSSDIEGMLNGSHGWVFPGGQTYSFTNVEFSDHQDLVADLLYVTPKA